MNLKKALRDTSEFARELRYAYYVKFRNRCPNCKTNKIQFVEGRPRFSKWWCTFCCSMSYCFTCPHCEKPVVRYLKFKPHIYKEYRLGKYRNDAEFFNALQLDYLKSQIKFHKNGAKEWEGHLREWKSRKHKQLMYARG